jgi:hypothetical protein
MFVLFRPSCKTDPGVLTATAHLTRIVQMLETIQGKL